MIKNTIIENNVASYPGGAIYATGDVDITSDQCEFSNNTAKYGAAIRVKVTHNHVKFNFNQNLELSRFR